jgi:hypothetical protein
MFVHQRHTTIARKNLATAERRQEAVYLLTGQEREEAEWILKHLELHERRMKELKGKINAEKGLSKKKTVVAEGRRLAEIMYSVLRNKTVYEPRPWAGVRDNTAVLTKLAMSA